MAHILESSRLRQHWCFVESPHPKTECPAVGPIGLCDRYRYPFWAAAVHPCPFAGGADDELQEECERIHQTGSERDLLGPGALELADVGLLGQFTVQLYLGTKKQSDRKCMDRFSADFLPSLTENAWLVLQSRLHQKSIRQTNSNAISCLQKATLAGLPSSTGSRTGFYRQRVSRLYFTFFVCLLSNGENNL